MLNYFLRRLALVPITFIVITFMVYGILRVAPGGPIEQLKRQMTGGESEAGAGGSGGLTGDVGLPEEALEELKRYYNLDKSIPIGYLEWLGVKPFDNRIAVSLEDRAEDPEFWVDTDTMAKAFRAKKVEFEEALLEKQWRWEGNDLFVPISPERRALDPEFFAEADALRAKGVRYYTEFKELLESRGFALQDERIYGPITDADRQQDSAYAERISTLKRELERARASLGERLEPRSMVLGSTGKIYHVRTEFSGILQGDFGWSFEKGRPALDVIISRMPISAYFGIIGYLMTWIICVPLGVFKAIRHNSMFDTTTSIIVFLGYAFPGFVACLLIYISFGGSVFPVGGFRSEEWDTWWAAGEYWRCIKDQLAHTAVPIFGYMVGSFAAMTVLMKNSLMENLGADYVRTAYAKGLPGRRVIFVHALRNSLIPITAGVGHAIGVLFAGSFLIERACNIPGMGLLGVESILGRDYPITLGILVFGVLIRLFGNILSDLIWAMIDPRIRFE